MFWPAEIVHTYWRHKTERDSQFSTPWFEKYPWKQFSLQLHQTPTLVISKCLSKYNTEVRIRRLVNLGNNILLLCWWFCWEDPSGAAVPLYVSCCWQADPAVQLAWGAQGLLSTCQHRCHPRQKCKQTMLRVEGTSEPCREGPEVHPVDSSSSFIFLAYHKT